MTGADRVLDSLCLASRLNAPLLDMILFAQIARYVKASCKPQTSHHKDSLWFSLSLTCNISPSRLFYRPDVRKATNIDMVWCSFHRYLPEMTLFLALFGVVAREGLREKRYTFLNVLLH